MLNFQVDGMSCDQLSRAVTAAIRQVASQARVGGRSGFRPGDMGDTGARRPSRRPSAAPAMKFK